MVGLINGILIVRTAVPSLIVTLGTLFAVQGLVLGLSVLITGTTSVALDAPGWAKLLFGSFIAGSFQVIIFWWLAVRGGLRLRHAPHRPTATGSSPWAATRTAPATSASRPTR